MRSYYFLGLLSLLLASTLPSWAQRPDTTIIRYSGQLTGQLTTGGVNRTLLATSHTLTVLRGRHFEGPVVGSFSFGKQERRLKERELLLSATPHYRQGRFRFYGIGGYERSNLRGIDERYQLGAGPGWFFYQDSLGREVGLSNLLIRESTYFQDGSQRRISRSSTRLKLTYAYRVFTLASTTFYQPNLRDFADYRLSSLTTLALRFTARLAFTTAYTYSFESRVLAGKARQNTNLTVGMSYSTR